MKILLIALFTSMSIFSAKANAGDIVIGVSISSGDLSSMSLDCLLAGTRFNPHAQCQQNKDISQELASEKNAIENLAEAEAKNDSIPVLDETQKL